MPELSVEITANIKRLEAELSSAKKELASLEGETGKTQKTLDKFSKTSGNSGKGLKQMSASILGPLGALIGVTSLTSALITFGPKIVDFINRVSEGEKALRDFNKAIKDGVGAAQGQLEVLDALLKVGRDTTKSQEERQRALNKINKEYKDLLPNLTKENVNTQAVKKAVDNLNLSLIRQAKIKGAQKVISEKYAKILELESQSVVESAGVLDFLAAAYKSVGNAAGFSGAVAAEGLKTQQKEIGNTNKQIEALRSVIQKLISEDINLGGAFTFVSPKGTEEKFKNTFRNLDDIFGNAQVKLSGTFNRFGDVLTKPLENSVKVIRPALANIETALNDFNEQADNIIRNNLVNTFAGIGQAIGSSILDGGNVFAALTKSLLSSAGGLLVELGTIAIGIGIGLKAIKKALTTLNPVAAIGAGIALIALGSVFKAGAAKIGGKIGGNAGGGSFSGGGGTPSFGGSTSTFAGGGFGGGEVVFRIHGTELVGVLNRTLGKNSRLGGSLSVG